MLHIHKKAAAKKGKSALFSQSLLHQPGRHAHKLHQISHPPPNHRVQNCMFPITEPVCYGKALGEQHLSAYTVSLITVPPKCNMRTYDHLKMTTCFRTSIACYQ